MRTIQQYIDWMKLCQQLDPDCTYFNYHSWRKDGAGYGNLKYIGLSESEITHYFEPVSNIEKTLYESGPQGLLSLAPSAFLFVQGETARIESLLERAGFEVDERTRKRDSPVNFLGGDSGCGTNYGHNKGFAHVQFFYGGKKPMISANIKIREGVVSLRSSELLEKVGASEAEIVCNCQMIITSDGNAPSQPYDSQFDLLKKKAAGMRNNSLPLLEAIVQNKIPAILQPKYPVIALLNLPE